MKRLSSLETLGLWARSHRWADLRRFIRTESDETFCGVKIRSRSHIVKLHNWSVGGVCIDMPVDAKLGEKVQLVAGTMRRGGRICWLIDGKAGIEFQD